MRAALFDVSGTLLDAYSAPALAERLFPGHGARFAQTWRDKQTEYTRLRALLVQYERLAAFPGSLDALECLPDGGVALGVPSNGDRPLVRAALDDARLLPLFKHVRSADSVRAFQTAAPVHALGPQALAMPANERSSFRATAGTRSARRGLGTRRSGSTEPGHRWSGSARRLTRPAAR